MNPDKAVISATTRHLAGPDALSLFAAALLLLIIVGSVTQFYRPGPLGVAVTELCAILLPALIWSRARRLEVLATLRLRPVAPWLVVSGLLLGVAWFYLIAVGLEPLMERIYPVPAAERVRLLRLLVPPSGLRPLWGDLLCFAGAPALCEEVLFRGVLLHSLVPPFLRQHHPRWGRGVALLGSALLFGAFHLSWAKLLPTGVLALGFGAVVLWTGSLWPAIAMHFANNTLVILLVRAGCEEPPLPSGGSAGWLWLVAALSCGALGLCGCRRMKSCSADRNCKKRNR